LHTAKLRAINFSFPSSLGGIDYVRTGLVVERLYLGNQRVLVSLDFGAKLVVPTWNLDVAVGIIRDGVIEPWTTAAIKALTRRNATYVNVGANLGYYMMLGAFLVERGGLVVAVEANPHLIPDLIRSTYWSGFPDLIRLHQCAVSDRRGEQVRLNFDPQFIGGGSILGTQHGRPDPSECFWSVDKVQLMKTRAHEVHKSIGFYSSIEVETETLDHILAETSAVDVLHMDIEGSEPAAILGAELVIRRSPNLSIVMEWSPTYARMDVNLDRVRRMHELLRDEGFRIYEILTSPVQPNAFPKVSEIVDLEALMNTSHCDLACLKPAAASQVGLG
jgi:FkbM family methyltransferase